jgi:aminoglycoside phosphotransferase (APT) family kinase protein
MSEQQPIEGVDLERLDAWMDGEGLPEGPLENTELLAGGTQNILLRFSRGGRSYVLRRPPPHKRKNSDETMRREARVLRAIAGSEVPHPGFIAGCETTDVLGAAFYLMEPIDGFNPSTGLPPLHKGSDEIRHEMGLRMAEAISILGELDYQTIGLDGFGKPDGYLERQVPRWISQLEGYSSLEGYPGPDIPELDAVSKWLEANRPSDFRAGVIHGDFHAANVMFAPDGPALAALVDWELSTVGDPLLDLGWLLATSPNAEGQNVGPAAWPNFPAHPALLARYAERSTRDLAAIGWYEVLACFKLGIILEGTHARAFAGKAPKATGDLLHATTLGLFRRAGSRLG